MALALNVLLSRFLQVLAVTNVVFLGVGHTHLEFLRRWKKKPIPDVRITCISNQSEAVYSGMLPGVLAGDYPPGRMTVDLAKRCAAVGAKFVLADTAKVCPQHKAIELDDGQDLKYDLLSIGIGSKPMSIEGAEHAVSIKPMQSFIARLRERISASNKQKELGDNQAFRLVVIGGGAAGTEISMCLSNWLARELNTTKVQSTLVHRGDRVLAGGLARTSQLATRKLHESGVSTMLSHEVYKIDVDGVWTRSDQHQSNFIAADMVVLAVGAQGPTLLHAIPLAKDDRGFLLTNDRLQSLSDPEIFVVGDTGTSVSHPKPKAGVYAVR